MNTDKLIIMSDIDGVVCDSSEYIKQYLITDGKPDWKGYFEHTLQFKAISSSIEMLESLCANGHEIHFMTGRPESNRDMTIMWFRLKTKFFQEGYPAYLHMRPNKSQLSGSRLKNMTADAIHPDIIIDDEEETCEILQGCGYNVLFAVGTHVETGKTDRIPDLS